ncbi:hypothetical protein LOTGIDRAFT_166618 [Lottia gigantea]|uniref:Uncharacterized protein n=1 Tax=Lottia gigantea TaxID=225164 RepID=V4BF28_LOTGI|nr:hypothetical protein LOTGIDRAFT_166618 [Lottia gigantea]ESO87464.1 hypothetical protein LOTGIDRAFT_166618 [Lottia gigantea]
MTNHVLSKSKGTSRFVAQYKLETTTLAVSVDSTKYALITDNESKQCTNPHMNFCQIKSPIFPINLSELCVMALFSKNEIKASSRCDVSVKPNEILPTSVYFTNGYWAVVVREQTRFSIVCRDTHLEHSSIVVKPPVQIIHLKPTCKAVNDHVTLPSHNTNKSTYFDNTSFKHLLTNFNESITDIWKPITDHFGNYTLTKLPPKLKGTETIPIEKLVSELDDLHPIENLKKQTWPLWVWVTLCVVSAVGILILYIVFKLYMKPLMLKFKSPWRRSDRKGENSGKVPTDQSTEAIPMVTMNQPSAPDDERLYPDIPRATTLHSLLNLAQQQRAIQKAETNI